MTRVRSNTAEFLAKVQAGIDEGRRLCAKALADYKNQLEREAAPSVDVDSRAGRLTAGTDPKEVE